MKSSLQVKINSHTQEKGVIYYNIDVIDDNNNSSWQIKSRYSQMRKIYTKLKTKLGQIGFPPKRWFGNTDEDFIQDRQLRLQIYFNSALKAQDINDLIPLKEFIYGNDNNKSDIGKSQISTIKPEPKSDKPNIIDKPNKDEDKKEDDIPKIVNPNEFYTKKVQSLEKIIDQIVPKFVSLANVFQPPDQNTELQKRQEYDLLKFDGKSDTIQKLDMPIGNEQNLIYIHQQNIFSGECEFVKKLNQFAEKIDIIIQKPKISADPSGIVHKIIK